MLGKTNSGLQEKKNLKKLTLLQIKIPPDKSLTHRAFIFAGLASGISTICNALIAADTLATLEALKKLGIKYTLSGFNPLLSAADVKIISPGYGGWRSPKSTIDFKNSGTSARLLIALISAHPKLTVHCVGDASLSMRPMSHVTIPLEKWGAIFDWQKEIGFLPIKITGTRLSISSGETVLNKPSAQLKSALLLAALMSQGEPNNHSDFILKLPQGARNHTELLLQKWGVALTTQQIDSVEIIRLKNNTKKSLFKPIQVNIPSDPSSAAFFAVLPYFFPNLGVRFPDLINNPTRLGFFETLKTMGFKISSYQSMSSATSEKRQFIEPTISWQITAPQWSKLRGCNLKKEQIPSTIDEIPLLACLSSFAESSSCFSSLSELRTKETDRLKKTLEMLTLMGKKYKLSSTSELKVFPNKKGVKLSPSPVFDSEHDHRLVMIGEILKLGLNWGSLRILGKKSINVSFPSFYHTLNKVKMYLNKN